MIRHARRAPGAAYGVFACAMAGASAVFGVQAAEVPNPAKVIKAANVRIE
jgi:hypothetical protein